MAKTKRPPTQKEIQQQKAAKKGKGDTLTILNRSKQVVSINCKHPPGSDFFVASQEVRLGPGKKATLPKSRLWTSQISRLRKRGMISVISDSEKVREKKEQILKKKKQREAAQKTIKKSTKKSTTKPKSKKSKPKPEEDNIVVIAPDEEEKKED
jgi:hypothetical protein